MDPVTGIHTQEAELAWANLKIPLTTQRGISREEYPARNIPRGISREEYPTMTPKPTFMIECGGSGEVLTT